MSYIRLVAAIAILLAAIYFVEDESGDSAKGKNGSVTHVQGEIVDYEEARVVFWRELYPSGNTIYCNVSFDGSKRSGINVEHVFPMSWATNGLDCGTRNQCRERSDVFNLIEADMHNLYPSLSNVNQARSSYAFAEVNGEVREFGGNCDFEVNRQRRLAEPRPEVRGDVARAMFYMAYRYKNYGLKLFARQGKTLLDWHKKGPPKKNELQRNNEIESLQNNRNPFVDEPELLDKLVAQGYFF